MTKSNILEYAPKQLVANGDSREWAVCAYYGIDRISHDHTTYAAGSDTNVGDLHISVKSSGFTLMSGYLCKGLKTFDEIWKLYKSTTHSNRVGYVDKEFNLFLMNIEEFEEFLYTFGRIERESAKNGGGLKIRCRKESQKMLRWLNARAVPA